MKKTNEEVKELKEEVVVPVKKKTTSKTKTSATKTTTKKAVEKKTATTKKAATKKAEPKTKAKAETKTAAKKSSATKSTAKASAKTSTKAVEKKTTATKKAATKKAEPKTKTKAETKTATKKSSATKSTAKASAKTSTKAAEKKTTATKKAATKKAEPKTKAKAETKTKTSSTRTTSSKIVKKPSKSATVKADNIEIIPENLKEVLRSNDSVFTAEYYDLPYRYNETTIKILAQSPHSLFLYWDVSDADKNNFLRKYGENFFNETKPVLLVHNKTQNYSFEVEVDDFTNSWYLRTPTSDCVFDIELARKDVSQLKKYNFQSTDNRLHISDSNNLNSPNDHILIETLSAPITFKNTKTNELEEKTISNANALKDYYRDFEVSNEVFNNPSSNFRI